MAKRGGDVGSLFVGRLSRNTRVRDLEEIFESYGRMTRCDIKYGECCGSDWLCCAGVRTLRTRQRVNKQRKPQTQAHLTSVSLKQAKLNLKSV